MTTATTHTDNSSHFDNAVILGRGYSAHLAAIALSRTVKIEGLLGKAYEADGCNGPEALTGQRAHSHIFLPRLENELSRIDPSLLDHMASLGFVFQPGSKRLPNSAPAPTRRLFATRWQFDSLIQNLFRSRVTAPSIDAAITGVHTESRRIRELKCGSGESIGVGPNTLVIDAMGAQSPIMKSLLVDTPAVINEPGNVAYLTQFYRSTTSDQTVLPDPLVDCPHGFGPVAVMLYPGAEGWFSISLAVSLDTRELLSRLRRPDDFTAFCKDVPNVAKWIDSAAPVGPLRVYINPRNRWNVEVFKSERTPANYLAVGDALTSMLPTLGANCSFSATHIRIARDLLQSNCANLQMHFAAEVEREQRSFFEKARSGVANSSELQPYHKSPQNRLSKRLKRAIRYRLGLDKARIERQLSESSSIS